MGLSQGGASTTEQIPSFLLNEAILVKSLFVREQKIYFGCIQVSSIGVAAVTLCSLSNYNSPIRSWVIFNHARPVYEILRNIKSNHALESSHWWDSKNYKVTMCSIVKPRAFIMISKVTHPKWRYKRKRHKSLICISCDIEITTLM